MASVKERMKLFNNKEAKPLLTPEEVERRRRILEKKRQTAIRVAKARAARYNMTLRSMTIQSALISKDLRDNDMQTIKQSKEQAAKYNATSRSLAIRVPRKALTSVAAALDADVNPATAKTLVELVAEHVAETDLDDEEEYEEEEEEIALTQEDKSEIHRRQSSHVAAAMVAELEAEEEERRNSGVKGILRKISSASRRFSRRSTRLATAVSEVEEIGDEDDDAESRVSSVGLSDSGNGEFYMSELADAVESGDDNQVNRAILEEFLHAHDPKRMGEVDTLLSEYAGREAELFIKLTKEYPDPEEDAFVSEFLDTKVSFADGPDQIIKERDSSVVEPEPIDVEEATPVVVNPVTEKKLEEEVTAYSKGGSVAERRNTIKSIKSVKSVASDSAGKSRPVSRKSIVQDGYILSGVQTKGDDNTVKWAVNVQARVLKERMLRAGVSEAAIDQIQAEDSGFL